MRYESPNTTNPEEEQRAAQQAQAEEQLLQPDTSLEEASFHEDSALAVADPAVTVAVSPLQPLDPAKIARPKVSKDAPLPVKVRDAATSAYQSAARQVRKAWEWVRQTTQRVIALISGREIEPVSQEQQQKPQQQQQQVSASKRSGDVSILKEIGGGGEAVLFKVQVGGEVKAMKWFRRANDEIYEGQDKEKVIERLREYPSKLAAFPILPPRVLSPQRLVKDPQGRLMGYLMEYVDHAFPLTKLLVPDEREKLGVSLNEVVEMFLDLHDTVRELHKQGVVIGDFRPENVLCTSHATYIVDAESMQYGGWKCHNFTEGWVDPKLCEYDAASGILVRTKDASPESDWFTFSAMLFQALTGLSPYAGTLIKRGKIMQGTQRAQQGESVFSKGVILPPCAMSLNKLAPEAREVFESIFGRRGARGEFPREVLERMLWVDCPHCHSQFSGRTCGDCGFEAPEAVPSELKDLAMACETLGIPANSQTLGSSSDRKVRYVSFHPESKIITRENGTVVGEISDVGAYERYLPLGDRTALVGNGECYIVRPEGGIDKIGSIDKGLFGETAVAGNSKHIFALADRKLLRARVDDLTDMQPIGIMTDSGSLWAGPNSALLLCDNPNDPLNVYVVNDTRVRQVADFPPINGTIVEANVVSSGATSWFLVRTQELGRDLRYVFAIDERKAALKAWTKVSDQDIPIWLRELNGKAAYEEDGRSYLLSATEQGLYRMGVAGERITPDAVMPATDLDPRCTMYVGRKGVSVVPPEGEKTAPPVTESQASQPLEVEIVRSEGDSHAAQPAAVPIAEPGSAEQTFQATV